MQSGGVYHVKFLGAYAMIDGGELDWKIICINVDSPLAAKLDTIQDVERWGLLADSPTLIDRCTVHITHKTGLQHLGGLQGY